MSPFTSFIKISVVVPDGISVTRKLPSTCNFLSGFLVPIPTLPANIVFSISSLPKVTLLEPLPVVLVPITISLTPRSYKALELSPINIEKLLSVSSSPLESNLPDTSPRAKLKCPFSNALKAPLPTATFLLSIIINFKSLVILEY